MSAVGRQKSHPRIAVIDYGMGNLRSVARALERSGADVAVVDRPWGLEGAAGLVLPGVGALADCVEALKRTGFDGVVRDWIAADRPFLGVCLGFQALFERSEEGDCDGLGIFPGEVKRFRPRAGFKVPHMGWNTVTFTHPDSPLLEGLRPEGEFFYFVHSYYVQPAAPEMVFARCDYAGPFTAAIARGNCYAMQFHPEKSQERGLLIYANFVNLTKPGFPGRKRPGKPA